MRKFLWLLLLALLPVQLAWAQVPQGDRPRAEIFFGYSNLQAEGLPGEEGQDDSFDDEVFGERAGLNGFNAALTGYITRRFGITGDFSFNQNDRDFTGPGGRGSLNTRVINVLGGPTVKFFNDSRVTPFARALFGIANTRFEAEEERNVAGGTRRSSFTTNATDFAMALGGGVDVKLNDRVDLRVLQVDYNPVFLRDRSIQVLGGAGAVIPQRLEGQRQDNIRLSFGVVFR